MTGRTQNLFANIYQDTAKIADNKDSRFSQAEIACRLNLGGQGNEFGKPRKMTSSSIIG